MYRDRCTTFSISGQSAEVIISESASNFREFFKELKQRGLDSNAVHLEIMDGLPGLQTVFKEEFAKAKVYRC